MSKQAAPQQAASAKPGTKDEKAKKPERTKYKVPEGGLEAVPADFDPKKHKPLRAKDFKNESVWWELKAVEYDEKAKEARKNAEEAKSLGSVKDKAKAKSLLRMRSKIAELTESLKAQGVDVDALLKAQAAEKEE